MDTIADLLSQHFGWISNPTVVIRQALSGVANGMLLFLISAGLTLIFGVTRILNFAHGTMFMFGAYAAFSVAGLAIGGLIGFIVGLLFGTAVLAAIGAGLEITLLRPIYKAAHEYQLLLTFGLVLLLGDAVLIVFGNEDHTMSAPSMLTGATKIVGVTFPTYRLFLIVAGIGVAVGLWLLLHRTRFGIWTRAATIDRDMLSALGVDTKRLYTGVFALGTALAGFGGVLAAPIIAIGPGLHVQVIIDAFIVVVIAGMGSVPGAFVASLLVGLVNAFGVLAFPTLAVVLTFALMALVLVLRPWGLFGHPE
ncbi:MAG: branched-chain amino acid ABC transporter permease [Alphaproteobacteria bacterium]